MIGGRTRQKRGILVGCEKEKDRMGNKKKDIVILDEKEKKTRKTRGETGWVSTRKERDRWKERMWGGWRWVMEGGMRKGAMVAIHADEIETKRRKKGEIALVADKGGPEGRFEKNATWNDGMQAKIADEAKKTGNEWIALQWIQEDPKRAV